MNWIFNGEEVTEIPERTFGFIYLITNKSSGKKYIGRKRFFFNKTKIKTITLKNGNKKKKKIKEKIESDWKYYYGSSKALLEDILILGESSFDREILGFGTSSAALSYMEAREQFDRDVLLLPEMYYNSNIMCKIHRSHVINQEFMI